jgi:hypothetical protein
MKTMIDRGNPLYGDDYKFRDIYLLASAAEDEPETIHGARTALQGWVDCFEKATLKGEVFAGGVTMSKDISGHAALKRLMSLAKASDYNRNTPHRSRGTGQTDASLRLWWLAKIASHELFV